MQCTIWKKKSPKTLLNYLNIPRYGVEQISIQEYPENPTQAQENLVQGFNPTDYCIQTDRHKTNQQKTTTKKQLYTGKELKSESLLISLLLFSIMPRWDRTVGQKKKKNQSSSESTHDNEKGLSSFCGQPYFSPGKLHLLHVCWAPAAPTLTE